MATRFQDLSVEDRIRLVEELWDCIAADQNRLPLTLPQREELDRRLDEFELDGNLGEPANEVLEGVRRAL